VIKLKDLLNEADIVTRLSTDKGKIGWIRGGKMVTFKRPIKWERSDESMDIGNFYKNGSFDERKRINKIKQVVGKPEKKGSKVQWENQFGKTEWMNLKKILKDINWKWMIDNVDY